MCIYSYEKLGHSRKGNVKGELVLARVNAIGIWRLGDYYTGLYIIHTRYMQYLYTVTIKLLEMGCVGCVIIEDFLEYY